MDEPTVESIKFKTKQPDFEKAMSVVIDSFLEKRTKTILTQIKTGDKKTTHKTHNNKDYYHKEFYVKQDTISALKKYGKYMSHILQEAVEEYLKDAKEV